MTNPHDPAHPQHGWSKDPETLQRMANQGGLTKREYFSAMALMGGSTNFYIGGDYKTEAAFLKLPEDCCTTHRPQVLAARCIIIADALIAELNKKEEPK
jgi:hypothetical protein